MASKFTLGDSVVLSSDWTGLNPHLVAAIYPVNNKGLRFGVEMVEVQGALTACDLEQSLTWQSPFENSSPDTKAPALTAMLQSGAIANVLSDLRRSGSGNNIDQNSLSDQSGAESTIREFQGRTGITQANSTQIFTGQPPAKITLTMLFRAFSDPQKEVEIPLQKLWSWAVAQELAADSIVSRVSNADRSIKGYLSALLPSTVPQMVGFQYKRRSFGPMVIESIGEPMNSPIDSTGTYTEIAVPITLCSLTALDKTSFNRIMNGGL